MKKLYLVDVSSMYFRAFYAIRPLSNAEGMPTNALYGYLSMITKLLKNEKPDYLAFCFDNKEPSFRKELYEEYKANRSEMPEELVPQVPYVEKLTRALGIPVFKQIGLEADDLIGSLTTFGRDNDMEVVIVSGDKDFGQLVQPFVSMLDTMKDVRYDVQGVQDKWGIPPEQVIDYLAMVGDSSDNIPGVRGIGPKGAQKLLAEFPTLEAIYESLDQIKNKNLAKKLEENKEMAFLSKKLVTIVTDTQLADSIEEVRRRDIDRTELVGLLEELDFKSFEKSFLGKSGETQSDGKEDGKPTAKKEQKIEVAGVQYAESELVESDLEIKDLAKTLPQAGEVWGFLTEQGISLAHEKNVYNLRGEAAQAGEVLARHEIKWASYDNKALWKSLKIQNPQACWDQMLASYVLKPGVAEPFDDLYAKYVGGKVPELPTSKQTYLSHLELRGRLESQLDEKIARKVYEELELPLIPVLYKMEEKGVLLDKDELADQSTGLTEDIQRLEKLIHEEAGEVFNVASTKQLGAILFDKMKIPPVKKTKTGYSTDNDVLEKLLGEHKIAEYVIEFRELSKLKSTYVDALPLLINAETGRVHTTLNQAHTATGRLSSLHPNLQNIPIRTERGNRVRRAFITDPGNELLSIDYSQIELRVLAHITEDPGLCQAFADGLDIHAATASQIYGVELEKVTSNQRRNAKAVNFGIAYGQGPFGLAETLGISRKEAADIIAQYFSRFSKVRDYMMNVVEQGKKDGYVESVFGRRRYLDELTSKNGRIRKFGERAAINAPIQGTASDIVKKAMIDCDRAGLPGMLLQVHDELLFEVSEEQLSDVDGKAKQLMEDVVELRVPLVVNSAHGKNWEEAH